MLPINERGAVHLQGKHTGSGFQSTALRGHETSPRSTDAEPQRYAQVFGHSFTSAGGRLKRDEAFEDAPDTVSRTVVLADRKVFVTPMEEGLRFGGTVQIAGLKRPPTPRRTAMLERIAQESFPHLADRKRATWMGHRPCMPDSLPRVHAALDHPGFWLAVGHGHLGLTGSLPTAALITQGICGNPNTSKQEPPGSATDEARSVQDVIPVGPIHRDASLRG